MNELQESMLAWAYRVAHENPHPTYCANPCRFGQCTQRCFDCSGFTYMAYRTIGITVGADTGSIARKAAPDDWKSKHAAIPGDLMLHRSGSTYNGGSDEHVGLFVRYEAGRTRTWESAGSQHGVGYYSRDSNWWTDAVRIPALHAQPDSPHPVPEDDDMTDAEKKLLFGILADLEDKVNWLLSGEIEGGWEHRAPGTLRTPKIQKKLGA